MVSLFDNYKKIKTTFIHNYRDIWYYTNLFYRDRNSLFIKDSRTGIWFGTSEIYFMKQRIMQLKQKTHLTLVIFFLIFIKFKKKELDT